VDSFGIWRATFSRLSWVSRDKVNVSPGPGVTEEIAENVGEKIREQIGFLEIVRATGSDQLGPMPEPGLQCRDAFRQLEGTYLLADDLRVKERFGFDGHDFENG
jgi:hypothetical protein